MSKRQRNYTAIRLHRNAHVNSSTISITCIHDFCVFFTFFSCIVVFGFFETNQKSTDESNIEIGMGHEYCNGMVCAFVELMASNSWTESAKCVYRHARPALLLRWLTYQRRRCKMSKQHFQLPITTKSGGQLCGNYYMYYITINFDSFFGWTKKTHLFLIKFVRTSVKKTVLWNTPACKFFDGAFGIPIITSLHFYF